MQLGALDAAPVDSTQDFMNAYNAVRPRTAPAAEALAQPAETPKTMAQPAQRVETPKPAVQPAQQPAPATADGRDPYADTQVVGLSPEGGLLGRREPDAVDELVDTLTGKIRLTPQAPAHTGFTQDLGGQAEAPAPHRLYPGPGRRAGPHRLYPGSRRRTGSHRVHPESGRRRTGGTGHRFLCA